jgi:hypothetical protein
MAYIRIPLETNPTELAQEVFDYINTQAPDWVPSEGNLDVWIVRAVAQLASENRNLATDVQDDIFRYFGANLVGVQPIDATAAQANTTWTLNDANGHTIPAGTSVGIADANGNIIPFQTTVDTIVASGSNVTPTGGVVVRAIMPGAEATGLGGSGTFVQLIDVLDWVASIVMTGPSSGGVDDEEDGAYLGRLALYMQKLSKRPILPVDFSTMALDADPIIQRAVAIDGFNPADSTYNNQRMVTIAAVDSQGNDVPAATKTAIQGYLNANREVNFIVNTMAPNYTTINITTSIHVQTGYTAATVNASVTTALNNYFSSASWGEDPSVYDSTVVTTWIDTQVVYFNEVLTLISNVTGVARVTALTLNGGTANINLTAPASLTRPGTVTVTDV